MIVSIALTGGNDNLFGNNASPIVICSCLIRRLSIRFSLTYQPIRSDRDIFFTNSSFSNACAGFFALAFANAAKWIESFVILRAGGCFPAARQMPFESAI